MAVKDENGRLNVTLSKEKKELLQEIAKKESRSASKQAAWIINKWLEENTLNK